MINQKNKSTKIIIKLTIALILTILFSILPNPLEEGCMSNYGYGTPFVVKDAPSCGGMEYAIRPDPKYHYFNIFKNLLFWVVIIWIIPILIKFKRNKVPQLLKKDL